GVSRGSTARRPRWFQANPARRAGALDVAQAMAAPQLIRRQVPGHVYCELEGVVRSSSVKAFALFTFGPIPYGWAGEGVWWPGGGSVSEVGGGSSVKVAVSPSFLKDENMLLQMLFDSPSSDGFSGRAPSSGVDEPPTLPAATLPGLSSSSRGITLP